jgi:hypothetical protein
MKQKQVAGAEDAERDDHRKRQRTPPGGPAAHRSAADRSSNANAICLIPAISALNQTHTTSRIAL